MIRWFVSSKDAALDQRDVTLFGHLHRNSGTRRMRPGPRNSMTDIEGLRVGNAQDHALKSGVTVLVGDAPFTANCHVMGGAPGTRETDLLAPDKLVQQSLRWFSLGLGIRSGCSQRCRRQFARDGTWFCCSRRGCANRTRGDPLDLANGGDKQWDANPYKTLGAEAIKRPQAMLHLVRLAQVLGPIQQR